ncbi:sensor histidine kinase [Prosthecodimorpha staleyi]|uniref:histidine kinase n=1 Tax=Prosthecodimorpha staleyi TaxID=2840188 RepID=A0A947D6C1_9HYPH|nr:HAMP domain-containing sensor histidine kinase [Prosthecodimorpha staleyi]MBT9291885.1 HAMP domain-containing histidine kinase [Prosthecodimorpha staleyi]
MKLNTASIRFRIAAVAGLAAASAILAAVAVVWSLSLAEDRIAGALSSQRRLDLWSAVSARISDYTFVALDTAERGAAGNRRIEEARRGVDSAFASIDSAVIEAIETAPTDGLKAASANRGRMLARLRAGFEVLDRQIGERMAEPDGAVADQIRGALNGFAVTFAPNLSAIMDDERRTGGRIQEEMRALRGRLTLAAAGAVALALALALWLFRAVARPLVLRLAELGRGAGAIGRGDLRARLSVTGRDELSLALAGFNRMAARLERREARVAADRARLEQTIAERTADLRDANQRLAAVDAARRRFFTDVSHELRTPLTVILGECDLALRRPAREAGDPAGEALTTIRTRAQRLHRRVEDLLRVARSETGEIDLMLADTPVGGLIGEAAEAVAALARRGGVSLGVEAGEGLAARADRDWMRQVIEGLLANAIRHTPAGGSVRVVARAEAGLVAILVADTGAGIAEADLPHIFDRFYRGAGSEAGSGFGIGLALAKWVVERHKGTIAVTSATADGVDRPRGTTVTIRLPAVEPEGGRTA